MKKEKKNRVKGIFGTVLFHALLLLLLSLPFMSLTYQDPPPKRGGGSIAINFSSEINTKPVEEINERVVVVNSTILITWSFMFLAIQFGTPNI